MVYTNKRIPGNKWIETPTDIKVMEALNFEDYSVGNPALSPDDDKLFFVSCAPFPWAKGQTDIHYVDIIDNSTFSRVKPVPGINTSGRENFPHMSFNGTLYFSSDGIYKDEVDMDLIGEGLLDIYEVQNMNEILDNNNFSSSNAKIDIQHLPYPFNTDKDDFAIFIERPEDINSSEAIAYFSSNRVADSARGDDDIYRSKIRIKNSIKGRVLNAIAGDPIAQAMVELIDSIGMVKQTVLTDGQGGFNFEVTPGMTYRIRGSKAYFNDDLINYSEGKSDGLLQLDLVPFPCVFPKSIQFENDSADITFQAKIDILPLLEILLTNPEVRIKIESYTDSREPVDHTNLSLSQWRADSTKDYLISVGVNENQIVSAIGYANACLIVSDEEIAQSPPHLRNELHAKNRRSLIVFTHCAEEDTCKNN